MAFASLRGAFSRWRKAAYKVIRDFGRVPLYTKLKDGKPQEFWSEIDTFLKVFGTIRTQKYIKKASTGWKLHKPRLQGWDSMIF
jgi:hypothetical protein